MVRAPRSRLLFAASLALCLPACASVSTSNVASRVQSLVPFTQRLGASPIQHVVYIIQENRSLDNMFQGYPGANTQSYGYTTSGEKVPLKPIPIGNNVSLGHTYQDFVWNYDKGKMDGFNKNTMGGGKKLFAYSYVPSDEIGPYLQMAEQWVLNDNNFASHLSNSFTAHQFALAAQANHAIDLPSAGWGCEGGPSDMVNTISGTAKQRTLGPPEVACFGTVNDPSSYQTLGDLMDNAGLSWRWYAPLIGVPGGDLEANQAVAHVYKQADYKYVISPETQILTDVPNGFLANMTWVTPAYKNSDHGGSKCNTCGPAWVASVVNAIGESQFWDSTVIFITWDEWGGLYDHVTPPQVYYDGLGMRVPLLCISPYAWAPTASGSHVDHTQLEMASVVTAAEDTFGLPRLADANGDPVRDSFAADAGKGCLNFNQAPQPFVPISVSPQYTRDFFEHEAPQMPPPEDPSDD